jgi:phage terminase large subunit-like protein
MSREIEVVGRDAGGVTYRFKGGRATVYVHEKSAVDLVPGGLERQLEAAERRLEQDVRANADVGERRNAISGPLVFADHDAGLVLKRGSDRFVIFDSELPAVYEAARKRWSGSYEKKKDNLLEEIRRTSEQLEAARDRLQKLKEEDGGLHLARSES